MTNSRLQVLAVYEDMVIATAANSNEVIAAVLSNETGLNLSPDVASFGNVLMDQQPIDIVVYNSLATERTEIVSVEVPICNVDVTDAAGVAVRSQVTAQFTINDGVAPFYDFDLHFATTLPPLGYATYTVTPRDSTVHCGGSDFDKAPAGPPAEGTSSFSKHVAVWPPNANFTARGTDALIDGLVAEQRRMMGLGAPGEDGNVGAGWSGTPVFSSLNSRASRPAARAAPPQHIALENAFLKVYIDVSRGIQAVLDKGTGINHTFTHELYLYAEADNPMAAYDFQPAGVATPVLANDSRLLKTTVSLGLVMQEARFQVRRLSGIIFLVFGPRLTPFPVFFKYVSSSLRASVYVQRHSHLYNPREHSVCHGVWPALLSAHADRVLTGDCNPMVCPV